MRLLDTEGVAGASGISQSGAKADCSIPSSQPRREEPFRDQEQDTFEKLFGGSQATAQVKKEICRVAPTSATVLITGESGTGKEVVAKAIHRLSPRSAKPFVPVNCGAISPLLIESELFGHERGSFTGAMKEHRGVFEQADGGTLFLDEITEMPLELQVKLLRVLESRRFVRVGGDREHVTDVRIIAATNRDLEAEVDSGNLREDLLYRLRVFPVEVPPLRQRSEDIPQLAELFMDRLNQDAGLEKTITPETMERLQLYSWPGNLRELSNVVQRAYIMADRQLTVDSLPSEIANPRTMRRGSGDKLEIPIGTSMADMERDLILATLEHCGGRRDRTARMLGVSMKTLYNRLRRYDA